MRLDFDISPEAFERMTQENCHYCGSAPSNRMRYFKTGEVCYYNGLDRLDSTQGHVESNCVPCCSTCNSMKRKLTEGVFLDHVKRIYAFRDL